MTAAPAIRPSAGERWLDAGASMGRASRTMAFIAGGSLLAHLAVVSTVAVAGRTPVAPPTEIAVEIVHDIPKPVPAEAERAKPAPAKPAPAPAKARVAKSEPVKSAATEPKQAKVAAAKSEPAKPAPKPAPAKPEAARVAKAATPAHPTLRPERRMAATPPASQPARAEAEAERKLASLQQELQALRAEQSQLRAEHADEARSVPAAFREAGIGLLSGPYQAVALPGTTDGAGESASYEALVFSALAKAKGIGHRMGVPGTAGVRFSVDAAGKLVAVELFQWSGIPELDAEALAVVRRASFPPPPPGAQRTFLANVNFEVDRGAH